VQPFPATGEKVLIAVATGSPLWSRDGKRLYFAGGNEFSVVDYQVQPSFKVVGKPSGVPRSEAVSLPLAPRNYDLAPDGKHFLTVVEAGDRSTTPDAGRQIQVVTNWFEELTARVPRQ
jgi:hypothetical protein